MIKYSINKIIFINNKEVYRLPLLTMHLLKIECPDHFSPRVAANTAVVVYKDAVK